MTDLEMYLLGILQVVTLGMVCWVLTTLMKLRDRVQTVEIRLLDILPQQVGRHEVQLADHEKRLIEIERRI